ncbi:MAG: single-stranded DNA-binding protein [Candidatus Dojkabacteria bacterium]|jgi:single-strand DNA-binding protein|nr:MAG: single-stranded DNA-binding protein [Candidatus Dojkabacteria bacterium]
MKSVNKVILIGNIVQDPEVVQISQDTELAKFTIAINESYKKPDGEVSEVTTYIDCEAWSGIAKVVKTYLRKGSRVYIEGNLRSDKWTDADTGKSRTKHKIRVLDLVMLDTRKDANSVDSSKSIDDANVRVNVDDELPF